MRSVFALMGKGTTPEEILQSYPSLSREPVPAVTNYAEEIAWDRSVTLSAPGYSDPQHKLRNWNLSVLPKFCRNRGKAEVGISPSPVPTCRPSWNRLRLRFSQDLPRSPLRGIFGDGESSPIIPRIWASFLPAQFQQALAL